MPDFRASKESMVLLLEANVSDDFKLQPMLIYHSKNPRSFKIGTKSTLPVLSKWENKAWMTTHLFTTWFTKYLQNILSLELRTIALKIEIFKGHICYRWGFSDGSGQSKLEIFWKEFIFLNTIKNIFHS